jgi:tetratricopeptide (TPR) repeat protein
MNATQVQLKQNPAQHADQLLERGQELIARARAEQQIGLYAEAEKYLKAAVRAFDVRDRAGRLAIAQDALANCYWRRGQYGKARTVLNVALAVLPPGYDYERAMLTVTLCQVHRMEKKYGRARELAEEIAPLIEALSDEHLLRARFHSELANVLNLTGDADRAIVEYTAASVFFEKAGHARHQAATDNNLADILVKAGRPADARFYLNRAERYYEKVEDKSALGQLYETRARSVAATDDLPAAEEAARTSIRHLEGGEEKGVMAESYKTLAGILAVQGKAEEAEAARSKAKALTRVRAPHLRLVVRGERRAAKAGIAAEFEDGDPVEKFVMPDESLSGIGIHAGDHLLATGEGVEDGDLAILQCCGEAFVGFYFERHGQMILDAENDAFEDLSFDASRCDVIGKVVAYIKACEADADDPEVQLI